MYEVWEVVRIGDCDFEPLLLVSRIDDMEEAIKIKNQNENYVLMVSNEN